MEQINIPPPVPPPAPSGPQPFKASGPQDERMWGMLCHLSSLIGLIGVPGLIGPLVIWLVKREQYGLVNDQGKEALNFQITLLIGGLICFQLCFVCGVGIVLLVLLGIFALVFTIIAAIKANEGVCYRYQMCIRLIK